MLSRLLWSLHHNYGAVGTGGIRDEKNGRVEKSDRWNVGQWRCAWGIFSLSLSVSLSLPGPQLKRLKRLGVKVPFSHTCLYPVRQNLQQSPLLQSRSDDRRQCYLWRWLPVTRRASLPFNTFRAIYSSFYMLLIFHRLYHQRSAGVQLWSTTTTFCAVVISLRQSPIIESS